MLAEALLHLLPFVERERRHAVIAFAEDERGDPARRELGAIAPGNAEATLGVDRVLVPAAEHPATRPRAVRRDGLAALTHHTPEMGLGAVVYGLSSRFIPRSRFQRQRGRGEGRGERPATTSGLRAPTGDTTSPRPRRESRSSHRSASSRAA